MESSKLNSIILYRMILLLQGLVMLCVSLGPFFDGQFDFALIPFAWNKTLGFLTNCFGFAFVANSVLSMRKSFTATVQPKLTGNLVTTGPFKFCRNPIYFGGVLISFGWAISFESVFSLVAAVLLTAVLLLKISFEEKELTQKFGEAYLIYKSSTKKIIPYIY